MENEVSYSQGNMGEQLGIQQGRSVQVGTGAAGIGLSCCTVFLIGSQCMSCSLFPDRKEVQLKIKLKINKIN